MLLLLLCVIVVVVNKANIIHTLVFKARPCGPIPVFDTMGFTKPKGSYCTASIISNCVKENGTKFDVGMAVDIEQFISVQLHSK